MQLLKRGRVAGKCTSVISLNVCRNSNLTVKRITKDAALCVFAIHFGSLLL